MRRLDDLTPSQLAWLTLLGGVLQGSIFLLPIPHGLQNSRGWIPVALALFVGGILLMLKSISTLKNGLQNERWTPGQTEPLRTIMESPFTLLLMIVLFGAFAVLGLLVRHSHSVGWAFYMPAQALSQLRLAFRQKTKKPPPPDFHSFAPISSEHWGSR